MAQIVSSEKHPTEEKLPVQCEAFRELIEKMYTTHLDKNQDYSPANVLVAGDIGVIVRMWDKFCRICNLSGLEFPNPKPRLQNLLAKYKDSEDFHLSRDEMIEFLEKGIKACEFDFYHVKPKNPANEPLDDAYLDMSVYSLIGFLTRQGKWGR